jgi:aspartate 1-decarboxylase
VKNGLFMQLMLLKSKLHRATVTHAELEYEGSCAIDAALLDAAGIHEYEQIEVYNVTNGERFSTYAIRAESGSGVISVNGAAAHRAEVGDIVIICTYAWLDAAEVEQFNPMLIYVNSRNRIMRTAESIPEQAA